MSCSPLSINEWQMSEELARQADDNLAAHFTWVQRHTSGMRAWEDDDLVVVESGLDCDTFNSVCRARLDRSRATDRIREVVGRFRSVRRPFSWWTSPADRPVDLGTHLLAAGLEPSESEVAMAVDLARVEAPEAPADLTIARVATTAALAEFARISAANWNPPDRFVVEFYRLAAPALLRPDSPLRFYLGCYRGVAVATAELAIGGGVVGLYNISTVADHRRRGIGTALTALPLVQARDEGYRTAILQSAPDGLGIYSRLGFRRFGEYLEYKPRVS
jgi:ribosomal protein S18 acetylase RimI-like enzyme